MGKSHIHPDNTRLVELAGVEASKDSACKLWGLFERVVLNDGLRIEVHVYSWGEWGQCYHI